MADPNPTPLYDIHEHDAANDDELEDANSPPPSPTMPKHRPRGSTVVSRVDIGHFDTSGVDELRRTMSRMSREAAVQDPAMKSELTLTVGPDSPF